MRELVAEEIIQTWDEDYEEWIDTKVLRVRDGFANLEIVDFTSPLDGMKWEKRISGLKWREKQQ